MGATDGETPEGEPAPAEERESSMDTLAVPVTKKKKKSPTPGAGAARDRSSVTPVRGRSQTPFSAYMNRRSATPSGVPSQWRSITPFLKREEKEKTPFELGHDLKAQLISNKLVFDKALVMDITEPEDPPARYITSDVSVIDRAAVMDVSNVEVIYLIEEYEEVEPEPVEEVVVTKKGKGKRQPRKARAASTDSKMESPAREDSLGIEDESPAREESPAGEKKKASKKKAPEKKKKDKKEKSPSPKLTLKLDIGPAPGSKASKKMFDGQPPAAPDKKPPAKAAGKSKLALQMEEQAKKAAEEAAKAKEAQQKPKGETFEEKQKRLKAEAEERKRLEEEEEERRRLEEELAAAEEEEEHDEDLDDEDAMYGVEEDEDEYKDEDEEGEEKEAEPEVKEPSVESFLRPNPEEEKLWAEYAEEEGQEFIERILKYRNEQRQLLNEKERDATWQLRREKARLPKFINFLTDRAAEEGQNVRLVCAVAGPELSAKWFKDGKQLEPGPRYRIINNNNILSLTLINPTIMDSGEYTCLLLNPNDEAQSSAIVTIYQVFKDEPSPPMFSLIRDYFHLHDDELTIECHCHGVPRPRVVWTKGGLPVKPSFKFTILEEAHGVYKLLIYRPSDKDSGTYLCTAINNVGEAEISHNVEFVKNRHWHGRGVHLAHDLISQAMQAEAAKAMEEAMKSKAESDRKYVSAYTRAQDEPPVSTKQKLRIATHLRDRIAITGSSVKLCCNILGPNPRIQWLKDDGAIQWSSKIRNLSNEGRAVLELNEVESSASGVYKLIAKNDHSEVNTSCYLKVHSAQTEGDESEPMFALPIKDVYHSSENDLVISTKVRGNPRPLITWMKDQLPVVLDSRIQQIEHLDGICELIINKPIQAENAGLYTCLAKNKLGEATSSHTVAVDNLPTSRRSSLSLSLSMEETRSRRGSTIGAGEEGSVAPKPSKKKKEEASTGEYERRHVAVPEPSVKAKLYLSSSLHNRYVPEGKRCKLQAMIVGPDPQIKWLKNGQNVVYGPKIRNQSAMGMAVLEFVSPTEDDTGEYTLIARNTVNEVQSSARLEVYSTQTSTDIEPVFTRALKDTYHLNRHELILETHCRGDPRPVVAWYKDNIQITPNERIEIITDVDGNCELIIDKPNKNDSGKYLCRAENSLGKSEVAHYVLFENEASIVAENIHGVFHADKSLLKKHEEAPEKPKPTEKEKKGKGGRESKDSKEETPSTPAEPEKKQKREKKIGIHFPTKLMNRVVAEGTKLKLSCFVQSPDPVVKWFRDDQPISFGPKSKLGFNQGLCTLEIPSPTVDDSGTYKVVAKDGTGEITTSCKVEVYADPGSGDVAPTFTRGIKDTYSGKTNELVLNCHVRGLPQPEITWLKDGVKIEANERYQITEHSDGTCELFIIAPIALDTGKYICRAENRLEEVEVSHQVVVEPRMVRPISPTRSVATDDESKIASREASIKPPSTRESSVAGATEEEPKGKKKKQAPVQEYSGRRSPPPPPDPKKNLHFANTLANRTVPEGSKVRMSVAIFGPDPQCRWYRVEPEGETPIAFGPKSKMSAQDNLAVLVLDQLTEADSGEYKLVARGYENTVETSCKVLVFPKAKKDEETAPVFTVGIKDNYSLQEDELVLDCRVRGVPKPKIRWIHDGVPIASDEKKFFQYDQADGLCRLVIKSPTQKDAGVYVCEADNIVNLEKISHHVDFAGKERYQQEKTFGYFHRDLNKPHLVSPLGTHIVTVGGTIAITAEFAETSGQVDVQWFKDKHPVDKSKTKSFSEANAHILAIENAGFDWDGTYTCRASNAYGKIESIANVVINGDAGKSKQVQFLSKPESEMKILVGDPFSISFRVQGDPKPKLSLMKGAKDITRSERVTKEAHDDYIRFTIHDSTIRDSGTYFVVARNEVSSDRIFTSVNVKTPTPKEPKETK